MAKDPEAYDAINKLQEEEDDEEKEEKEDEEEEENPKRKGRSWEVAFKLYVMRKEREPEFVKKCPQEIRGEGVRQFIKALHSTKAAEKEADLKGEERKKAKFQFRSKKRDHQQSFVFQGRTWKSDGVISKLFLGMNIGKEKLPACQKLECEVKITRDKLGRVFFCVTNETEKRDENQAPRSFHSTAALDPGVRTFQTIYDADGQGVEWGAGDMKQVFFKCRRADSLQKKIARDGMTSRRRRAYHKVLSSIKHVVKECHVKLALFLCENYRVILIPDFGTSRMIRKRDRKLHTKTVRSMCTWSHFSFKQTLLNKAQCFPWSRVVVVGEAYTSKTCDECGGLNQKLGSKKVFTCPHCGNIADRDIHAAKNILLRYLTREVSGEPATAGFGA